MSLVYRDVKILIFSILTSQTVPVRYRIGIHITFSAHVDIDPRGKPPLSELFWGGCCVAGVGRQLYMHAGNVVWRAKTSESRENGPALP